MNVEWSDLERALDALEGPPAAFWLRDDDAVADTRELRRLGAWAEKYSTELLLAVIPALIEDTLESALRNFPHFRPCVHGWAHKNHAPPEQKKQELGTHRSVDLLLAELSKGLSAITDVSGGQDLPVLVPPWNRIDGRVVEALPDLGYAGLSVFEDRFTENPPAGLVVGNTHLDVIDWRGTRGCKPEYEMLDDLISLLSSRAAAGEPIGVLTHHLVHDEPVWAFLDKLGGLITAHPKAKWVRPETVFAA